MKIYIVSGYAEYFYPKLVTAFDGLVAEEGQVHVPQLTWMRSAQDSDGTRAVGLGSAPYHSSALVEGDVAAKAALLCSYLEDTTKPGTPVALLLPDDALTSSAHDPHAHRAPRAALARALRQHFGDSAVVLTHLCLGAASRSLLARLQSAPLTDHASAEPPGHLTCVPGSPLFEALRRNLTYNAVRLATALVLERQDRVFEPGLRPGLIADALDRQGVRIRPDVAYEALLQECEELCRRHSLALVPTEPSANVGGPA